MGYFRPFLKRFVDLIHHTVSEGSHDAMLGPDNKTTAVELIKFELDRIHQKKMKGIRENNFLLLEVAFGAKVLRVFRASLSQRSIRVVVGRQIIPYASSSCQCKV